MISTIGSSFIFPSGHPDTPSKLMVLVDSILAIVNSTLVTVCTFVFLLTFYFVSLMRYGLHRITLGDLCLNCEEGSCYLDFIEAVSLRNKRGLLFVNLIPLLGPCITAFILFWRIHKECPDSVWNSLCKAYADTLELPLTLIPQTPYFKNIISI